MRQCTALLEAFSCPTDSPSDWDLVASLAEQIIEKHVETFISHCVVARVA